MSKILSRFRRSPSRSSVHSQDDENHLKESIVGSTDGPASPFNAHRTSSGSVFVEDIPGASPRRTPNNPKSLPPPLAIPPSGVKPSVGTPKLVLTEEGSSPRSFLNYSPQTGSPSNGLGLGMAVSDAPNESTSMQRPRSASMLSDTRPRAGSTMNRLSARPASPSFGGSSSRRSSVSTKKKGKRSRRKSVSSGISNATSSIAHALAKSGLHIASPSDPEQPAPAQPTQPRANLNRSPWLVRGEDDYNDEAVHDDEIDDEEDETDSEDDHLPVTGFAVASNRRQAEFHALFPAVDEGDYLIEDYGCALSKDILVQGRLYVSENHLCFHANIFGWVTDLVIAFTDIRVIERKMTALVIPNAIGITANNTKYTFASFISRDSTYDVMMNIWRLCNPHAVMSTTSFAPTGSRPASIVEVAPIGHAKTQCACGRDGKHYSEIAMDATFHSTPEKVYNLMFNSDWYKRFLSETEKLREVELSEWRDDKRTISYIKPLNGSIGPKQTKCYITDEHEHRDYDQYVTMLTTTKTPDVPSGGVFSVKTRTCFTWAGANSTRVVVTTMVEWTGKSWVKGIIEKSAIEGQKTYHEDLETGMKGYIKDHAEEFGAEVVEIEEEQPTAAAAYAAEQKQKKEQQDRGVVQAVLDTVSNIHLTKETILALIILILVLSNIYTYYTSGSTKRVKRVVYQDESNLDDTIRSLVERKMRPLQQAEELNRILDDVEQRVVYLRATVAKLSKKSIHNVD